MSIGGLSIWLYKFIKKPSGIAIGKDCVFCYLVSSPILGVIHIPGCSSHTLLVFKRILKVFKCFGLNFWGDAVFG